LGSVGSCARGSSGPPVIGSVRAFDYLYVRDLFCRLHLEAAPMLRNAPCRLPWLVLLCCCSVRAAEKVISLVGDETKLTKVKANPRDYVGREFILTGVAEVSDYFNYGYRNSQDTHYAVTFREALGTLRPGDRLDGEECHLYLRRDFSGRRV